MWSVLELERAKVNKSKKPIRYRGANQKHRPPKKVETNAAESFYAINSLYREYKYFGKCDFGNPRNLAFIKQIQANPHGCIESLIDLSWLMYNTNGSVRNTVDNMVSMPTLDSVVVTYGSDQARNKKYKTMIEEALVVLKDREFIRDVIKRALIEGASCSYIEIKRMPVSAVKNLTGFDVLSIHELSEKKPNSVANISSISLPPKYTKIVGYRNGSPVLAFDLRYFDHVASEKLENRLRRFPEEIRKGYYEYRSQESSNSPWLVLNNEHTVCVKFGAVKSDPWGRPLALAAIDDIAYNDYFKDTKRRVLDDINNRLYIQTFPEGKEKGTSALTKKQQDIQHNVVKEGVKMKNSSGGSSNLVSVAAGTKIDVIDPPNQDIFDQKYESDIDDKIALDMGFACALINGVGSGNYAVQTLNLEMVSAKIFEIVNSAAMELNKVLNAQFVSGSGNRVEVNYLPMTYVNRDKMVANMKQLYVEGRGPLSLWASACGIKPSVFVSLLDYEKAEGWDEKYPVHATSYNSGGGTVVGDPDSQPGRPTDDDSTNPNTVQSKANNANDMPKPSTDQ